MHGGKVDRISTQLLRLSTTNDNFEGNGLVDTNVECAQPSFNNLTKLSNEKNI